MLQHHASALDSDRPSTGACGCSGSDRLASRLGDRIDESAVHGICFHGIGTPPRILEPGEARYWISIGSFHAILEAIAEIPSVRISFDDGNASDVEVGLEALLERGLRASFFVVAGRIGSTGSLDENDIRELARHGMTIGSHGMDHRPWPRLSPRDRERELVDAREQIAEVVGRPVDEAALPMGAYDRRLLRELRRLGYRAVHTSDRRSAKAGAWLQPRFSVVADDTTESVLAYTRRPSTIARARLGAKALFKSVR